MSRGLLLSFAKVYFNTSILIAKVYAKVYIISIIFLQKWEIAMFFRKIEAEIVNHLKSGSDKILLVDGARQVGKSFIIRHVGNSLYKNYIEINMYQDKLDKKLFADVADLDNFYLKLSIVAEGKLGNRDDTIVFIDEIQTYPQLLALLKFLRSDGRYTYIASGSMLGIALKKSISIPMGSIEKLHMYPMDFEEFLIANNVGSDVIKKMEESFNKKESLPEAVHQVLLRYFKYYLISGGLPDAVNAFVVEKNVPKTRLIQRQIYEYYSEDASQYDEENNLNIKAVYKTIPSRMENKKKRIIAKEIENKAGARYSSYANEFEYLLYSGIALGVSAVPTPTFPLVEGIGKNLLKLYMNDPGILTALLYDNNINAVLNDEISINLGSVYESAVASELKAHGFELFYYDNRKKGEVDFLIDDYETLSTVPMEIKSGKDYSTHASLDRFINNKDYHVKRAFVFSNSGKIIEEGTIIYYPIYMCMFIKQYRPSNIVVEPIGTIEWE